MPPRDPHTLDIFRDFAPPPVVARYSDQLVRSPDHRMRVALAVAACLKAFAAERDAVAAEVSAYLGEKVSKAMLDKYASPANADPSIPAHRLIALAVIAGDARLINALLADTGLIAVDAKYEALIGRELARERMLKLQREIAARDAEWRATR